MQIKEVRSYSLKLPLEQPVYTSNLTICHRDYVFVEIETQNGIIGHGIGFSRNGLINECIQHNLRPILLGQDVLLNEKLWQDMYMQTRYLGRKGIMMRAISAVDIAIWDIKGKIAGLPLWKMLGGMDCKVKAYVAGGYYRKNQSLEELKREFTAYRELGFQGAKMNMGGLPPKEDIRRVKAVREVLGDEMELMLDFNGSMTSAKPGAALAQTLEEYDISFIEEPFLMDQIPAMRELRSRTNIPIAVGEDESGRWSFRELVIQQTLDILRHDATLVGGITEWVKVAHFAQAFQIPLFPHWFPEIHIHLAAAFPNSIGVELIIPETGIMNLHQLLHNPLKQEQGYCCVSEEPGLGLHWDLNKIHQAVC